MYPSRARRHPRQAIALAAIAAFVLTACSDSRPMVVVTEVPPAAEGGPDRMAQISGRVHGARPGDTIVLFAKSGFWYVQPFQTEPFTTIRPDGTWSASIHLGSEYAAMLVRQGYQAPRRLETLPQVGGSVVAVTRVNGAGDVPQARPRIVSFSGYDWTVRQISSERGGFNQYAADNVRIAADGALHLSLTEKDGLWSSAEVSLTRPLGYGTYTFTVRDTGPLDPAALLTFYTYDEDGPAENFREMAISVRQPDGRGPLSGQYILQPNYVAANVTRFVVPPGVVTHSLRWEPGRVVFASDRGSRPTPSGSNSVRQEFTVGVPSPGKERVRMALYYSRNSALPPERNVEVVIERFQHFP